MQNLFFDFFSEVRLLGPKINALWKLFQIV